MPGEVLIEKATSKLAKFVASIPTSGQGLLHLVEDVETGFVKAFPSLEGWALASQEVAQAVIDGVTDVEAPNPEAPAPAPTPVAAPAPAPVPVPTTGPLAASGVAPSAPANVAPAQNPDLPALGG